MCTQKGTQHGGLSPVSRHALPISACEKPVNTQPALLKARDQYHFDPAERFWFHVSKLPKTPF